MGENLNRSNPFVFILRGRLFFTLSQIKGSIPPTWTDRMIDAEQQLLSINILWTWPQTISIIDNNLLLTDVYKKEGSNPTVAHPGLLNTSHLSRKKAIAIASVSIFLKLFLNVSFIERKHNIIQLKYKYLYLNTSYS